MVRIGISEGWGSEIRGALGASLNNRFKALLSGLGVTMLLQSSSATALLTSSFSGQGLLTTATALAVLLGADVGTTLVAQILTFDFSALSPMLIAVGVALFTYSEGGRRRDVGRLLLGLGMMLLALKLIVAASLPMLVNGLCSASLTSSSLIMKNSAIGRSGWASSMMSQAISAGSRSRAWPIEEKSLP